MDNTNSFDRLQKEIDALTYNSRSVLNALIRSVLVSGSSNGFSITKFENRITLSVIDIYRLYNFYTQWEANGFAINPTSKIMDFNQILAAQNLAIVRNTNAISNSNTTSALLKHSQILYLTQSNLDKYIDVDSLTTIDINNTLVTYWLGLIENNQNPKLVSNSAPIPINLRTPIFDENLSTTAYNQYNSYLFPMSYYAMSALGYSGDGLEHTVGGKGWSIICEDFIRLEAGKISMGGVSIDSLTKKWSNRNIGINSTEENTFSTAFGFNTFARSMYSIAGGYNSVIPEDMPSSYGILNTINNPTMMGEISLGNSNISSAGQSTVIGGSYNSVSGNSSVVIGGVSNKVDAPYGNILGGISNTVGSVIYNWTTVVANQSGSNPCNYQEVDGECVLVENNSIKVSQIVIDGVGYGFNINDTIVLSDFTVNVNGLTQQSYDKLNGQFWKSLVVNVLSVSEIDSKTVITFDGILPVASDVVIDGGKLSLRQRTYNGTDFIFGYASTALNNNTIANGMSQTVVGSFNKIYNVNDLFGRYNTRFVVGVGTDSLHRMNKVEVTPSDIFLYGNTLNNPIPYSRVASNYTHGYIGLNINGNMIESVVNQMNTRLTKTSWEIGFDTIGTTSASLSFLTNDSNNNRNYSLVLKNANSASGTSSIKIFTGKSDPSIYSPSIMGNTGRISRFNTIYGTNDYRYMTPSAYDIAMMSNDNTYISAYNLNTSSNSGNVKIYASNSIVLLTDNLVNGGGNLIADISGDINLKWSEGLLLNGNTYGTLVANNQSRDFRLSNGNINDRILLTNDLSDLKYAGFYSYNDQLDDTFTDNISGINDGVREQHIVSSYTVIDNDPTNPTVNTFSASQLRLPGFNGNHVSANSNNIDWHKDSRVYNRSGYGTNDTSDVKLWHKWRGLAWFDEIKTFNNKLNTYDNLDIKFNDVPINLINSVVLYDMNNTARATITSLESINNLVQLSINKVDRAFLISLVVDFDISYALEAINTPLTNNIKININKSLIDFSNIENNQFLVNTRNLKITTSTTTSTHTVTAYSEFICTINKANNYIMLNCRSYNTSNTEIKTSTVMREDYRTKVIHFSGYIG